MNGSPAKNSIFQVPEACPICSQRYGGVRASLVRNKGKSMLVHITCPRCQTSVMSSISLNNLGVMAIGMLSDLEKEDLDLARDNRMVGVDDVIEMHEIMEKEECLIFNN